MALDNLQDLFIDELKDIYNAEKQLTRALPQRFGLLFEFIALRLQARFPIRNLRLAAFHLGEALLRARFVGDQLLNVPIQLRLALI